jgi:hypothetical protein
VGFQPNNNLRVQICAKVCNLLQKMGKKVQEKLPFVHFEIQILNPLPIARI